MPAPYNYCSKPFCRIRGESDMGYFVDVEQAGDPFRTILGLTAVNNARACGFTDEEIVYYCRIQGKSFGPAARGALNCTGPSPYSCSPSTYVPPPTVGIYLDKPSIINDGSDFAYLSWSVVGHYNSINVSPLNYSTCSQSSVVLRPTQTTTYTITVCNDSGCVSRSVTLTVNELPPTISYFTASPTPIIKGESVTLSWSVTGKINSVFLSTGNNVSNTGTLTVTPIDDTVYTLTASGPGGSVSSSKTVVVYIPPVTTLSLDRNPITLGESTTLRWTTTGDVSSANIQPGIGQSNANSSATISPTETTTYTISVSGLGGTDSDEITLTVNRPPSANIEGPQSVNYGEDVVLSYEATNAVTSVNIIPTYTYKNSTQTGNAISITPGQNISGNVTVSPDYNNYGPTSISYRIDVVGYDSMTATDNIVVSVNVDETPDNIIIPASDDKLKNEDPVITPDETITSHQIQVNDIDIPVEIKSNKPVQVEINADSAWRNIRSI